MWWDGKSHHRILVWPRGALAMRGGVSRCKAGLDFERGENQLLGTRRHQLMEKRESIHLTLVSILPFFSLSWGCGRLRTTWLGPLRTF